MTTLIGYFIHIGNFVLDKQLENHGIMEMSEVEYADCVTN